MRTTINIDDQLYIALKKTAVDAKKPMTKVIEEAIQAMLTKNITPKTSVSLKTTNGKGLKHGINIDDGRLLLDVMDDK